MENDDKPVYSGVPGYPIFRETRKWMQAKDQKSSKKTNQQKRQKGRWAKGVFLFPTSPRRLL
jgi:hypothetical protein